MNRIRELREIKKLRQTDLAQAIGIDQRSLSNYETGKTTPDGYTITKLAEFFGVTCDYLLGVTDMNLIDMKNVVTELEDIKKRIDRVQKYLTRYDL